MPVFPPMLTGLVVGGDVGVAGLVVGGAVGHGPEQPEGVSTGFVGPVSTLLLLSGLGWSFRT